MRAEVYIRSDLDVRYRLVDQAAMIVPAVIEMAGLVESARVEGNPEVTSRL